MGRDGLAGVPSFFGSARFGLAVIGFAGFANLYALRVNMSVALVCMLNATAIDSSSSANTTATLVARCGTTNLSRRAAVSVGVSASCVDVACHSQEDGEFAWTKNQQGLILGSFFWGYILTQIPGGLLAERFGGKRVFLWNMLGAAVCTLLCPLAARFHYGALVGLRVVIGIGEGVAFPAMHSMWSQWAPPLERSKLTGVCYAGAQIGNVLTLPLSGLLCSLFGWPSVFYLFGSLGIVWCAAWHFVASNSPSESRFTGEAEREYIRTSLTGQICKTRGNNGLPWSKILTSFPVWAINVGHTCANFGTYLVLTNLPTFMGEVLNFDIKSNGLFSAIPYIGYWLGINVAVFSADTLRRKRILNTTHVRKLMMIIALGGQGCCLVATGYCRCGQEMLAVALITLAQTISGFQYGGFVVNHVDIAPRYAGTLFGLSNTFATVSGIVVPSVAAALTPDWRTVFWAAAGVLWFGCSFFALFGSGELQPWAVVAESPPPADTPTAADAEKNAQSEL